jgi:hypothetical protein
MPFKVKIPNEETLAAREDEKQKGTGGVYLFLTRASYCNSG